jgi:hypothetical protein
MSRIAVVLLCGVLSVAVAASTAAAQSLAGRVTLSATVLPQATIERLTPAVHRGTGDTAEYQVTVVVRANAPYRVVARRRAPGGPSIALGVDDRTARLDADRNAVQIARGAIGVTTFEITYFAEVGADGAIDMALLDFEALPDSVQP